MIIRAQRDADVLAVRRVLRESFGDGDRVPDLAEALAARRDPGHSLVAEIDGEVVGHVQLSRSWVDAPRRIVDVLVLSPLGVRPDRQRQGIGTALVAAALRVADEHGAPAVFLEGDPAYYSRLGFEPGRQHGFTPPSAHIPDPGFQVVVLPAWTDDIIGALVYNDTFWSHACVGLRPSP